MLCCRFEQNARGVILEQLAVAVTTVGAESGPVSSIIANFAEDGVCRSICHGIIDCAVREDPPSVNVMGLCGRLDTAGAIIRWPARSVKNSSKATANGEYWVFDTAVTVTFSVLMSATHQVRIWLKNS